MKDSEVELEEFLDEELEYTTFTDYTLRGREEVSPSDVYRFNNRHLPDRPEGVSG